MERRFTITDILDQFALAEKFLGVDLSVESKKDNSLQFAYLTNYDPDKLDLQSIYCACDNITGTISMELSFYETNNEMYKFLKEYNAGNNFLNKKFKSFEHFKRFFMTMQKTSAKSLNKNY